MIDKSSLVAFTRAQIPDVQAVVLAGSSILKRSIPAADIDVIVFSKQIETGDVVDRSLRIDGVTIDFSIYHPLHFRALAINSDLAFYHLREIRKFLFGEIVFDDGSAAVSKAELKAIQPSRERLKMLYDELRVRRGQLMQVRNYSRDFFLCLESAIFLRMHLRTEIRFSKHKYLLEDAANLPTNTLENLLLLTAKPLNRNSRWPHLCHELSERLNGYDDGPALLRGPIRDALWLIDRNFLLEATFPFRYVAARTYVWANGNGIRDSQLNSILAVAFAENVRINPNVLTLFDALLSESQLLIQE